jgi:hypothetical protein
MPASEGQKAFNAGTFFIGMTALIEVIDWWSRLDFVQQLLTGAAVTSWLFRDDVRFVLLVLGLVLVYFSRRAGSPTVGGGEPPTKAALAPPIEVSFQDLMVMIAGKTDLAALDMLRSAHPAGVLITGHLSRVDKDLWGTLTNADGRGEARLRFKHKWRQALTDVPAGQLVTVCGTVGSVYAGEVRLDDCELVRTVPGSEDSYRSRPRTGTNLNPPS